MHKDLSRYWEDEEPVTVRTGVNVLRWYKQAGRLQVSYSDYVSKLGERRIGKTVALTITEVSEDARLLLRDALGL